MKNNSSLYNLVKKISKEVRFGNLLSRISPKAFTEDKEFINDFNNMLDAISDREKMIKEYQSFIVANNEFLKSLFNMLNEGAMTLSADLNIIEINDTQAKWFRKPKKQLVGKSIFDILKRYEIIDFKTNKKINPSKELFSVEQKNYKLTFKLKKIQMTFVVSIKQFKDNKDNINHFIVSKDITTDVKMQKQRDTFIATLTHDLKVPILAEAKVLELLSKESFGEITASQREAIDNILSNNNDMLSLVTTLLDVYKIDDGVYKINPTKCDIDKIIDYEIDKLRYLIDTNSLKIQIKKISRNFACIADFDGISRVFKNIISNAIDFAPHGSRIKITIQKEKDYIITKISDKGKGISKENLPFVFERYFTTDKKYRKVGTGLGLYLSKKIVNLHGGEIYVESIPDKETIFTVKLPVNL